MDTVSIAIIIVGVLLKIIDDYYDMDLFNEKIMMISQLALVMISLFLFLNYKPYVLMTTFSCLSIWFYEGQMSDKDGNPVWFYYLINIIAFGFFIYYLFTSGYSSIFEKMDYFEIFGLIYLFISLYFENKWFPEDVSISKIIYRILLVVISIFYLNYEEKINRKVYELYTGDEIYIEKKTVVIRLLTLLAVGYFSMSVINMMYAMLSSKTKATSLPESEPDAIDSRSPEELSQNQIQLNLPEQEH